MLYRIMQSNPNPNPSHSPSVWEKHYFSEGTTLGQAEAELRRWLSFSTNDQPSLWLQQSETGKQWEDVAGSPVPY